MPKASAASSSSAFEKSLCGFADSVTKTWKLKATMDFQPEDQLKAPVMTLIKSAGVALKLSTDCVTELHEKELSGRPDVGVTVDSLLTGHVELKAPGKGADPTKFKGANKAQWEKFKDLPNLIYTDGNAWTLFRSGERVGNAVRMDGDITEDGQDAVGESSASKLFDLLRDFLFWQPIVPSNPKALANLLAPLCRLLRTDVAESLTIPESPLQSLAADWRAYLFPDATDHQFADSYAQTFTYALLLARLSGADDLSIGNASQTIKVGHRLLADTLKILGDDAARHELAVPIDMLERVLSAVDVTQLTKKANGDPWLYFYEEFLAAYDPKMRADRGVFYTPVEIILCQVRLVSALLEKHFDAEFGFVDPHVVTLDPAAGTASYVLTAIQESLNMVEATRGAGMRASAASTAANNVHAFELLVGPYAVGHLRLTQQILAEGGSLPPDGVHVYLTDTLEAPHAVPPGHLPLAYKTLGEEHKRAQMVKSKTPVFVCIGNPPYNREERSSEDNTQDPRNGGWVRFGDDQIDGTGILHDFVAPLTAAGLGVHAKNLYNDYVYFWRWALWKVFEAESSAGPGIVSFITAASYLRGPGFAGMRQVMRERFDDLWIIDLEGGNLGARKTENVFAIQSPVAIAVGVRYADSQPSEPARVRYTKIEGTHQEKLHALESVKSFGTLLWQECPSEWLASFLPSPVGVFPTCPLLTDLFPWQESGMQFKRSWPISEDQAVLEKRWSTLIHGSNKAALFKESRDRKITKQYPRLDGAKNKEPAVSKATDKDNPPPIGRFAYRSFDRQWALIDSRCGDYLRPTLHQTHGTKQVYMTSLLTEVLGNGPAAVATELIPDLHHFRGSFGGAHVIPLWRDPAGTIPNVTAGLVTYLSQVFGSAITAEQLFEYAYAVLATPDYVCRFWNELLQPGPRIPITADPILFQSAADVGRQLLWLHTFGERFVPKGKKRGRLPMGTAKSLKGTASDKSSYPTDYAYDPNTQELRVGTGVFSNVRSQVWGFTVSGLQVVESWLGHRMQIRAGKKSSALDDIRPAVWHFDEELLDLLWVLDATIDIIPQATAALKAILSGDLINAGDLPVPTAEERRPPILGASEDVHQESIFGG